MNPTTLTPTNLWQQAQICSCRRFQLVRDEDVSGVSSVGIVAEGVVVVGGAAVLRWRGSCSSTGVYESVEDVERIHGHGGRTRVVWMESN